MDYSDIDSVDLSNPTFDDPAKFVLSALAYGGQYKGSLAPPTDIPSARLVDGQWYADFQYKGYEPATIDDICAAFVRARLPDGVSDAQLRQLVLSAGRRLNQLDTLDPAFIKVRGRDAWYVLDLTTGTAPDEWDGLQVSGGTATIELPDAWASYWPDVAALPACPRWLAFLSRVQPDADVRAYLKRLAGYCAYGDVRDEKLFLQHGTGRNGKDTFWQTVRYVLGDYAQAVQANTVVGRGKDTFALAQLEGARLAVVDELQEKSKLRTATVKALTGGGAVSMRGLYQDARSVEPTWKIVVITNHLPDADPDDIALWARIEVTPWNEYIPDAERDTTLKASLRDERAGILRWIVEGAMEYARIGLSPPAAVTGAGTLYHQAQDSTATWLGERAERGSLTPVNALYADYTDWCAARHIGPDSKHAFGMALTKLTGTGSERMRVDGKQTRGRTLVLL